jgi:UDP-N-acetylmuramoylalanine--D-glutamate ligase
MLGHIMERAGLESHVCGNIGNPLSSVCRLPGPDGWLIVEVSSFQLHHIRYFRPAIAAILNVSPDHMDWYDNYQEYLDDKKRILMNLDEKGIAVHNAMDRGVESLRRPVCSRRYASPG